MVNMTHYFTRCERGEATAAEYADALSAVQNAFEKNQRSASGRALALRSPVRPVKTGGIRVRRSWGIENSVPTGDR